MKVLGDWERRVKDGMNDGDGEKGKWRRKEGEGII